MPDLAGWRRVARFRPAQIARLRIASPTPGVEIEPSLWL